MTEEIMLLGQMVKHPLFGAGKIIAQNKEYITVEFATKTSQFQYPDVFKTFLKLNDSALHDAVVREIDKKESAAELARLQKEAKRRKAQEAARAAATAAEPNSKRTRTLDEMFAPDYHAEKLARQPILTYKQVEEQFGIRISGFGRGINPTANTVVLISSIGRTGGNFVYHDKWTADGDYLYSGEGRNGNQSLTNGNLAITNAKTDGKTIHLFVKFSPSEYYYQGIFKLIDYTYEDEKDENGNIRKEYKFRLRKDQK
jgi:hypothetical protein